MDTRAQRRLSRGAHASSLEVEDQASFPSLTELALALPWKMAQAAPAFLRAVATRLTGDGIDVSPMSAAWLIEYEAACGKQGDAH
jgi:hypothetical protein